MEKEESRQKGKSPPYNLRKRKAMEESWIYEEDEPAGTAGEQDLGYDIHDLFRVMIHHRDSTALFIVAGSEPTVEIDEEHIPVGSDLLSAKHCRQLIEPVLDDELKMKLQKDGRIKFIHTFEGKTFSIDCGVKDGSLSASIKPCQ